MDNSQRFKAIQELNEILDISTKHQRIKLGKLIYEKYPNKMVDKGNGISVNIADIPTEFLRDFIKNINDTDTEEELEFWQTLVLND